MAERAKIARVPMRIMEIHSRIFSGRESRYSQTSKLKEQHADFERESAERLWLNDWINLSDGLIKSHVLYSKRNGRAECLLRI